MRVGKWRLRGWPLGFGIELGNKVSWTGEWRLGMGLLHWDWGQNLGMRLLDRGVDRIGMRILGWGVEPGNEATGPRSGTWE